MRAKSAPPIKRVASSVISNSTREFSLARVVSSGMIGVAYLAKGVGDDPIRPL